MSSEPGFEIPFFAGLAVALAVPFGVVSSPILDLLLGSAAGTVTMALVRRAQMRRRHWQRESRGIEHQGPESD